ncbi:MAG: hypothetical protein FJ087_13985 [Deltaproteobacteria bacterium]|nr:hypothetical protein [Deltaproteobacteria bacterium]
MSPLRPAFLASFLLLWTLSARVAPGSDAATIRDVARAVALEGRLDLDHPSPGYTVQAPDGRWFAKFPLLASLVAVPAQYPERLIETAAMPPADKDLYLALVRGLTPAAVGAAAVTLLLAILLALGHRPVVAAGVTAAWLFATCALPYLRSAWSEGIQLCAVALCLLAAVRFARVAPGRRTPGQAPGPRDAILLGLSAGLVLLAKPVLAPFAGATAAGALVAAWPSIRPRLARVLAWAAAGALPPVAASIAYDFARSGSPLMTDYGLFLVPVGFTHPVPDGLYGLLLSPGRGLAWYAPVVALSVAGAVAAARERPRDAVRIGAGTGFLGVLLLYSAFTVWHGGEQWGPRFLVPMLAPLAVLGAPVAERLIARGRPGGLSLVAALVAAGLFVNVPGLLVSPSDFFSAVPYRPHSEVPLDADLRPTEPVEADNLSLVNHVPAFSPISGHRRLLGHAVAGGDPAEDAPWIEQSAGRPPLRQPVDPRLDLWFVPDARRPDVPGPQGLAILAVLLLATLAATVDAIRSIRRAQVPG